MLEVIKTAWDVSASVEHSLMILEKHNLYPIRHLRLFACAMVRSIKQTKTIEPAILTLVSTAEQYCAGLVPESDLAQARERGHGYLREVAQKYADAVCTEMNIAATIDMCLVNGCVTTTDSNAFKSALDSFTAISTAKLLAATQTVSSIDEYERVKAQFCADELALLRKTIPWSVIAKEWVRQVKSCTISDALREPNNA